MATRQLTIKTAVVSRVSKELEYYKKEAQELELRAQKLETEGADEYEARQARRIHSESARMIPDGEKRLQDSIADLKQLVISTESTLGETDEWKKAKELCSQFD